MRRFAFVLMYLFFASQALAQKAVPVETDFPTTDKILDAVKQVFPEAYADYVEVTYETVSGKLLPKSVSFCIPSRLFKDVFTINELNNRKNRLAKVLGIYERACPEIGFTAPERYDWPAWDDSVVRRVTYLFVRDCKRVVVY